MVLVTHTFPPDLAHDRVPWQGQVCRYESESDRVVAVSFFRPGFFFPTPSAQDR